MAKKTKKNIYISWHYTTHGIAYFKHILSAFYAEKLNPEKPEADNLDQQEMEAVFDKQKSGFTFDKVYYLTAPQKAFDALSARRFFRKKGILDDRVVEKSGTKQIWDWLINEKKADNLEEELKAVKEKYPKDFELWKSQIWRNVQHYSIEDQRFWLQEISNAPPVYTEPDKGVITFKHLEVPDLRDAKLICSKLYEFISDLRNREPDARYIINLSLGSNETQVAWQIFGELNLLPIDTKFILTYDKKHIKPKMRFKPFKIQETPVKILQAVSKQLPLTDPKAKSAELKLTEAKFQHYLDSGFAICLLGERGTGKSRLAEENKGKSNFVSVNCASFPDDTIAESELFGYKKGAFTGADSDKDGLFKTANGGILFLDEIHHLSKRVQAKLMKALQTDENNKMKIRPLGSNEEAEVEIMLITASNNTVAELQKKLLPDFYDRIMQLVIETPPLRKTPEDMKILFESIWKQMKFEMFYSFRSHVKRDNNFFAWLKQQRLPGNYRDLQKIAIYYKMYLDFKDNVRKQIPEKTAFEFARSQYEKYSAENRKNPLAELFNFNSSPENMQKLYRKRLAEKSIRRFGSARKAAEHFRNQGSKIAKETLYKWKNAEIFQTKSE